MATSGKDITEIVNKFWMKECEDIAKILANKWWCILDQHYKEEHRHYHTLEHIVDMCNHWNENNHLLRAPKDVFFAILFHDVIYDTKASDNEEKSAELFMEFAKECFYEKGGINAEHIRHMILLSKDHQTDAHFYSDRFGDDDVHYFLDMDMAILGQRSDVYDQYASKIRLEFHHIEDYEFYKRRAQVLTNFLNIPKIFCTKEFSHKYESQAKKNLQCEIAFCKKKGGDKF